MAKPTAENPERRTPDADTADPHRAEPAPPPQEGLRPETDAAVVRPESDEPGGPVGGLFHTAAVEAAQEAPVKTPGANAEAAYLGIEEEGVESSQIFGLMLATVVGVISLGLALYFIFYLPKLNDTAGSAEAVPLDRRVEQREVRADAENLLGQYAVNPDAEGRYRVPVGAAMQQTVQAYGGRGDSTAAGPVTRADFNLAWITPGLAPSVNTAPPPGGIAAPAPQPSAVESAQAVPAVDAAGTPSEPTQPEQ